MSITSLPSTVVKSVMSIPRKLFGTRNDRMLKGYQRRVAPINAREADIRKGFDEAFASRCTEARVDDAPAEEREGLLHQIRVDLSADLRVRVAALREKFAQKYGPIEAWWNALTPSQRLEEYYRGEYRRRNTKVIDELDAAGDNQEAFAVIREASRRARNHRHFDCQLVGGRVLYEGKIAEMRTGEGKTIVCHLAAFLNVLGGKKVHVVTVNDYLVRRDAEFAASIFELTGISVGYIQAQLDPGGREGLRQTAYACDITYGTNSEFGFDYLRDNMKTQLAEQVQGRLDFVVVDEVDSILIDEARTPLIISGPTHDDISRYPRADKVARELVRRQATWDRKVQSTVEKYDGNDHKIPKLANAMAILGYKEKGKRQRGSEATRQPGIEDTSPNRHITTSPPLPESTENEAEQLATLGPDFLTDDQVEAIQTYEATVLNLPQAEQYRRYFIIQMERKQAGITHDGVTIAQELLDLGSLYSGDNMEWPHLIENSLRAHKVYYRDKDYVVQDGQIIIVDPFTGRLMHGRQWSDGLHQSVEAKEAVRVKEETQTLATITIQNFIKLYRIKSGMTGTAMTEANEFDKIYKLDVVEIPTNRPINRVDHNDKMYRDTDQKFGAIVDEIFEVRRRGRPNDPFLMAEVFTKLRPILVRGGRDTKKLDEAMRQFNNAQIGDKKVIAFMLETYDELMGDLAHGRPVLVGTTSVENSEKISRLLTQRYGIDHEVLNAKNHAREAEIVVKAGETSLPTHGHDKTPLGNVTIATNMAGRGTDIKLSLGVVYPTCKVPATLPPGSTPSTMYPPGITKCCIRCEEYDPATNCAHCFKPKLDPRFPALGRTVCPINVPCGLHIVGTERHEARRIDNQLRGRAGRQGDPGSSRFFLSLQDDLLKLFMSDWMLKMMERLGFTEGASLEDKRLTKGIERAQRKVEERNFSTRKHLLEWDEPMDFQRREFYSARQRILEERDLPDLIFATIDIAIRSTLKLFLSGHYRQTAIVEWCRANLDLTVDEDSINISDLDSVADSVRRVARDEAQDQIRTSLGEYIDADEPPANWDLGGLTQWAKRAYDFQVSQNHLRKMEPREIEEALFEAAEAHIEKASFEGITVFLDPQFPHRALADWAKSKFNIQLELDEILDKPSDDIRVLLDQRVRDAYRQREIAYPVEWVLERAIGEEGTESATSAQIILNWVNGKFNVGWKLEDIQGRSAIEVRDRMLDLNRDYFAGRIEKEIDAAIVGKTREQAVEWAQRRFGRAWNQQRFERDMQAADTASPLDKGGSEGSRSSDSLRTAIVAQGREMLRWELTRLEHFVLLRIYDQAWKDHLLEMDHLKTAIMQRPLGGDQTHPQSQFAIEGRQLFDQMWSRIAGRVTDMIFKVRASGPGESEARADGIVQKSAAAPLVFRHAEATGAGFSAPTADQQAAMKAQGVEAKIETIRREEPKVGRNDPCPCGSGKKFKQCHGRGA